MNWNSGNWTSSPDDGRAFLERDIKGWAIYATDADGRLFEDFRRLSSLRFDTLEEAQAWVEENVPARETSQGDST